MLRLLYERYRYSCGHHADRDDFLQDMARGEAFPAELWKKEGEQDTVCEEEERVQPGYD